MWYYTWSSNDVNQTRTHTTTLSFLNNLSKLDPHTYKREECRLSDPIAKKWSLTFLFFQWDGNSGFVLFQHQTLLHPVFCFSSCAQLVNIFELEMSRNVIICTQLSCFSRNHIFILHVRPIGKFVWRS